MPHSHHSHSGQFCKHASGTLGEVVLEAIKQGFDVYGLTEHAPRYRVEDLYPEEEGLALDVLRTQFDQFLDEAHRLKETYAGRINLFVGLETEFITEVDITNLEVTLKRHEGRIEYLVGSIHHANGIPIDFDEPTFQKCLASFGGGTSSSASASAAHKQMEAYLCSYFDAQYEVLQRLHPEVIGHIDLCRLYNPSLRLADYPRAWEKLERNIRYAIEYDALFELNAAALRKKWDTSYPGEDVAQLIMKHSGRFALSDDSHGPHAVGLDYDRMAGYAQRIGINELWTLERKERRNAGGRYLHPVKVEGDCWKHVFWERRGSQ
ncbi:histidinol phosphate phosphatase H [Laetiporus sulphureus 93-53]|uniref:Histidinol-phosphatase n=1 Tax=Laetiporus sulphureus 93-53 TaxID=1314785 RepID=A0A165G752_9APHY|nr:histidinol phosphate phosphatase H [Laetiporus sulphureus 93-53]KZT09920.1 histidinol phosphate phosphatase H [Laetiporus sulphureus 93-53]